MASKGQQAALIVVVLGAVAGAFAYLASRDEGAGEAKVTALANPDLGAQRAPRKHGPSTRDSLAALQGWLKDSRPKYREFAIVEITRRPPSGPVLKALIAALDHPGDEYVRSAAAKRLAALGPKALPIAQAVADCVEQQRTCGQWGGLVLGNMGPGALPQLALLARRRAPAHARRKAAYALSLIRCHGPNVTRLLRKLASDKNAKARTLARAALRDPCTRAKAEKGGRR